MPSIRYSLIINGVPVAASAETDLTTAGRPRSFADPRSRAGQPGGPAEGT